MDFNGHMKNTGYLDAAADVRMQFFVSRGLSIEEFAKRRIGPVMVRDELEYFRELRLLDPVDVTLESAGVSPDGSRFRLRNTFYRDDGKEVARVTSVGVWLDLLARRVVAPPDDLRQMTESLSRTGDFQVLENATRPAR